MITITYSLQHNLTILPFALLLELPMEIKQLSLAMFLPILEEADVIRTIVEYISPEPIF